MGGLIVRLVFLLIAVVGAVVIITTATGTFRW